MYLLTIPATNWSVVFIPVRPNEIPSSLFVPSTIGTLRNAPSASWILPKRSMKSPSTIGPQPVNLFLVLVMYRHLRVDMTLT